MNNEKILYYLGILENGALNYYQTVETIRIASQSIQDYIERLEEQNKKQQEAINKTMCILKDNFVYDYVRSCDTADEIGFNDIDTEHFTYKAYEILEEVSE